MKPKNTEVIIREAQNEDWAAVSELLAAAKLVPLDDTAQFGPQYAVAEETGGAIVGVAGCERYGTDILLRSVAVAESRRSEGIGARLIRDRIAWARDNNLRALYLLTTTAADYFAVLGFRALARGEAPEEIRASREFAEACPQSAVFMHLSL